MSSNFIVERLQTAEDQTQTNICAPWNFYWRQLSNFSILTILPNNRVVVRVLGKYSGIVPADVFKRFACFCKES